VKCRKCAVNNIFVRISEHARETTVTRHVKEAQSIYNGPASPIIMKNTVGEFDSILSPLEQDVLTVIWPDKKLRVRQIYDKLKSKRKLALSSVAVILDRLHERSVVGRKMETGRGGVRYIYYPKSDKRNFEKSVVEDAVNKLIKHFGSTAVSYFNERFARRR